VTDPNNPEVSERVKRTVTELTTNHFREVESMAAAAHALGYTDITVSYVEGDPNGSETHPAIMYGTLNGQTRPLARWFFRTRPTADRNGWEVGFTYEEIDALARARAGT
jgi:hypothetical protein